MTQTSLNAIPHKMNLERGKNVLYLELDEGYEHM
jgi:hypothetical protein